jgi:hypothetical protein
MLPNGLKYLGNNALGALALFVALGGTTYAATGGFTGPGNTLSACVGANGSLTLLKSGKKCHKGQQKIAWNQTGPPGSKGATGPSGPSGIAGLNGASVPSATNAQTATNATTATTALTANNALALGGIPASGFTRSDCGSQTGQIKGFVEVPASGSFPSTFTKVAIAYNCSGEAVEAKRNGEGEYQVRFLGNPAVIAVATSNAGVGAPDIDAASVDSVAPGEWLVAIFNIPTTSRVDDQFELLVP